MAVRRLRAILRAARGSLDPEASEPLRDELSWLGGALGPARDLDVLLEHLEAAASECLDGPDRAAFGPLLMRLRVERKHAYATVVEALESERYLSLLESLDTFAADPPVIDESLSLPALAADELGGARKAAKELGDDPADDSSTGLRIRVKRLRYAAELAEPLAGKPAARVVDRARAAQDALGAHQDAVVAEERLRALARDAEPAAALAAGRLIEAERRRRRNARREYPRAWARLQKAARRAFE